MAFHSACRRREKSLFQTWDFVLRRERRLNDAIAVDKCIRLQAVWPFSGFNLTIPGASPKPDRLKFMPNRRLRLLYLGNAFPPGMTWAFRPFCLTASVYETRMVQALSQRVEIATVGLLPAKIWRHLDEPRDDSCGLEHELLLWDRDPKLWHRWHSWRRLRRLYFEKTQQEGMPDVVLVRNLQHVFNYFVKWLQRQPRRPLTVLLLGTVAGLANRSPGPALPLQIQAHADAGKSVGSTI